MTLGSRLNAGVRPCAGKAPRLRQGRRSEICERAAFGRLGQNVPYDERERGYLIVTPTILAPHTAAALPLHQHAAEVYATRFAGGDLAMNLNPSSSVLDLRQHLLRFGVGLFLFSTLIGLGIPRFAVPLLALSAHLIGILQATFIVAIGLLLPQLRLATTTSRIVAALLIYSCLATMAAYLAAAIWNAGNSLLPLAAGPAHGTALQEAVINVVLHSVALTFPVALVLILWGLRKLSAY